LKLYGERKTHHFRTNFNIIIAARSIQIHARKYKKPATTELEKNIIKEEFKHNPKTKH